MGTSARTAEGAGSRGLEALYVAHASAALRFAFYLSGDREQARDLVQDAFVRVAGRLAHLRRPDVFETYLRSGASTSTAPTSGAGERELSGALGVANSDVPTSSAPDLHRCLCATSLDPVD